ncbi:hypothetical protein [Flagellimonas aequoris]|uniref:Lipoprotein n=1 Tax=Flagellimonas aequoris TaxID=2306997 RepID=A0A418NBI3_9FLAO|nr:hypothetical protein [Allomuricauda aequoris]RIV73274.1 hypothetical protein D2U88_03815 [Allomuricauda aequoris]TXK07086.1 hypothetical protein FQ019_03790 [Allomuricauda aequoris]
MKKSVIVFSALLLFSCSQSKSGKPNMENLGNDSITQVENNRIAVLNELRNELLLTYGTIDGWSRVDMGPCGEFAYAFYEEWNSRFKDSVNIVFMMKPDGSDCNHVLVRLPDKNLFDAGLGVMDESALKLVFIESKIEDMVHFDYDLLEKWSYGLHRKYYNCPNYSDSLSRSILKRHFDKLALQNNGR